MFPTTLNRSHCALSQFSRALLVLISAVLSPLAGLSQTTGIVTDDLFINYDTDLTTDGTWLPTIAPGTFGSLLGISSSNSTQNVKPGVLLNIESFQSVNTGNRAHGFEVTGATWGGVVGTAAQSRSSSQEFWIRPENVNQDRAIIWETGGGTGHSLTYNDDGTNAHLVFRIANGQTAPVVGNSDEKLVSVDLRNFNPGGVGSPVDLVAAQDFIQVVAVQDYTTNSLVLYVNGQLIGSTPNDVFNSDNFSGGDAQSLFGAGGANIGAFGAQTTNTEFRIDDGIPGNGNGTVLSTGQYSGFRGDVAIHRTYASETDLAAAILTPAEVLQNFQAVNPDDIVFDNAGGAGDTLWSTQTNWVGGAAPTAAENAYIVGNGGTITAVSDAAGQVANNVLVGRAEGAVSGDGILNVSNAASNLSITNDLWLGAFGGNGTVNVSDGNLLIGQDLRFDAQAAGSGVGGTLNVSGGQMEIARNVSVLTGTSLADLNLSGTGTLFFSDGRVDDRTVGNFTQTGTSTLRFALFKPNGFTPLNVTGTADIDAGSLLRIGTPGVPPANPLIETHWTAGNSQWDPDAAAKWDSGRPDGVAVIGIGDTIDVITTASGFADGDLPTLSGPDTNWTPSIVGNNLIVTRNTQPLDLGPLHAVFAGVGETITRTTDLVIRESEASTGADAARLSIRDGTLDLTGGANLILGGTDGGQAFVGSESFPGGVSPALNVSGDVIFGSGAGTTGGRLNVLEGTATIAGNILASDPAVVGGEVNVSGGTLSVTGNIDVPWFIVGGTKGGDGAFTLGSGQNLTAVNMTVGDVAKGEFTNDGGTVIVADRLLIGNFDDAAGVGSADLSKYTQNSGTTTVTGAVELGDGVSNGADGSELNILGGTFTANSGLRAAFSGASGQTDRSTITVGVPGGGPGNPVLIVSGGNLETANNHNGTFTVHEGSVFLNAGNLIIGQGTGSNSDTDLLGGVVDLRGQDGTRTDGDVNFNNGTGRLTINGGTLYVSNDLNMGSFTTNNQGRTNRFEMQSGTLYIKDDINTRNNGTGNGNKIDIIEITGGEISFGEGFAAAATGGNAINFDANAGQAGVNTYNVFDWTGGTIRGLESVTGIANITGSSAGSPTAGSGAPLAIFQQQGGTLVLEAGTTEFDGNVAVFSGAIWDVTLTADDALSVTPNPTPNRAGFINADNDLAALSTGGETFDFQDGAIFDIKGSGGSGDTSGANAVTFDATSSLVWDSTADNWSTNVLPSVAAVGQVADIGAQFVIAESSEASIIANLGALVVTDTDWVLSLGTNDPNTLGLTNNQLIATRQNTALNAAAASLAIIDTTAGGVVQRNGDLLLTIAVGLGADAAALQVDDHGLNLTGASNLIIGAATAPDPGESFVNQTGGVVTIGGDLVFGRLVGDQGGEYTAAGGSLTVNGNVVRNTVGENADFNFDGGAVTFNGTTDFEDIGIGRKAGNTGALNLASQVINVDDDVIVGDEPTSHGTLTVTGTGGFGTSVDDLFVGVAGTGLATFGDNTVGTQPTLSFNRADVGVDTTGDGTLTILNGTYSGNGGMVVATNAGSTGAVVIGDGTVNSNPVVTISNGNTETANSGTGSITINSGIYNQTGSNFIVGQGGTSDATLNVTGGELNVSNQLRISNAGKGVVNLSGGVINATGTLDMGNSANTEGGTLNISGAGVLNALGALIVGNHATAVNPSAVSVSSGSLNVSGATTIANAGNGSMTISGGDVNVTGNTTVGVNGEGELTITGVESGQQHDLSGILVVGATNNAVSKGTVTINMADPGDTVNTGQVRVGANGQSQLDMIEGTMNVSSSFNVAYSANSSAANGRTASFTLGNGTSTPTLNVAGGNFEAALAGTGVTTIKSGTYNQNDSNLIIGQSPGSNASFVVENGDVNVHSGGTVRIGNQNASTGSFEVQNGTVDAGAIDFGGNITGLGASTNAGTYTQTGGTVTAGNFSMINGGNTVSVSGGSLSMASLLLDADPADVGSTFDFSGGTINTSGNVDYRAGFSDISISQTADVNIGGNLNFDGGGSAGNPNTFSVINGSATIDVTGDFTMTGTNAGERVLNFVASTPSLTPVSAINVGGTVTLGGVLALTGFDALSDWTSIFGGTTGSVTLINSLGVDPIGGDPFFQANGSVWAEGVAWQEDPQWTLSYAGGTGNDVVLNYSAIVIPEPSRMILLTLGVLGVVMRRRRK